MRCVLALTFLTSLALVLTACGGNAAGPTPKVPTEVRVTLSEFKVDSSLTNFIKGVPYRFVVTNKGAINHEFIITTSMMAGMAMPMEDMHKSALALFDENALPPGATKTIDVTFKDTATEGELEIACHIAGHYEAGMRVPITVNSSSQPPTVAAGAKILLTTNPNPPTKGTLELIVTVNDASGQPITDADVFVSAKHTEMSSMRMDGKATAQGEGRYAIKADFGMTGNWKLTVLVRKTPLDVTQDFDLEMK